MSTEPIRFVLGIHLHQPVGNFDHVIREHMEQVYLPFLERSAERGLVPLCLHVSGPLLAWLERHDARYLDLVGGLASDGRVELLTSGHDEPVLAVLSRQDRLQQIQLMNEELLRLFGVRARSLWLTERVWEPDLPVELAAAGVRSVLVDDRHFLVSGFRRDELHRPYWTEAGGSRVALFPIDEKLRYLVPFKPPHETIEYLESLRRAGHGLAVLADDGEKFGGWPGTREWLYERGWLDSFLETMADATASGIVRLSTLEEALDRVPSGGLAYLPTASYREMEAWALPPAQTLGLEVLERDLGEERLRAGDASLVRGSHWRHFMVKYPEANRMHKKMMALSSLSRERGDPPEVRRAIGRAQCNDAYWHGVFGGLYLKHLREAVWRNLAQAEAELRQNECLEVEYVDLYGDGDPQIWLHSPEFSAVVSPARGGSVLDLTLFRDLRNYADILTRRKEAYHRVEPSVGPSHEGSLTLPGEGPPRLPHEDEAASTPTIHEIEGTIWLSHLPPVDREERAPFVDRVLDGDLSADAYATGAFSPVRSFAAVRMASEVRIAAERAEVRLLDPEGTLEKLLDFHQGGQLTVTYRWDRTAFPEGAWFAPELSLGYEMEVRLEPEPAETWRFPVSTVSKSERGVSETVQGFSLTPLWPVTLGRARISLRAPASEAADAG